MIPLRHAGRLSFAVATALLALWPCGRAFGDAIPGIDWHVQNAEAVAVVQAEGERDAAALPPPEGKQRVFVREVLKGFVTRQTWLIPAGTLRPGQEAVVLKEYHPPADYQPALQAKRMNPEGTLTVWPIVDDLVRTGGVPAKTTGRFGMEEPITLKIILEEVGRAAPEEAGLSAQLLTAWLFPDRLENVLGNDPKRLDYVRFVVALRDLERDVPALADLLESRDGKVRAAAAKKLRSITRATVEGPKDETPASLHAWSQAWHDWWEKEGDGLAWDGAKACWVSRPRGQVFTRRWPEVPADFKRPPDRFPPDLLRALERKDPAAFAAAFPVWLDSGVLRDRQIKSAEGLSQQLKRESNLEGGSRYLPPTPWLRADVLFGGKLSVEDRAKVLALIAHQWHFDRFARERRTAAELIPKEPLGSENIRRAAFWEMLDTNVSGPGFHAIQRLGESAAPADQKLLGALFLEGPESAVLSAARVALQRRHKEFAGILLEHLRTHNDRAAEWAARWLALEKQADALPTLIEKLKSPDAAVRKWSAFALCWNPSAETVPALLAAIKAEKEPAVRAEMLTALAQTGDARGLDVLTEASKGEYEKGHGMELARGLSRIRDKKALPALAAMAERFPNDQQYQAEVVNAFGWVSGLYKAFPAAQFWSSTGTDPERLKTGQAEIAKWRAAQPK
jgi:HEAT repeat protein